MSDDSGINNSFLTNLTNKVKYKINTAVTDPNANKYAEEKKKIEEEKKEQLNSDKKATDNTPPPDPNKFNLKRFATNSGNQALNIVKKVFFPFIALMLAMIVTNELIIYAPPIRIIFFIFTIFMCIRSEAMAILLSLYYILKGAYGYYVNNMTDRPKRDIMPTIYALLPITTYKPASSFASFFMYPFTYPKTEKGAIKLPLIMDQYYKDLVDSFKDFDKIKNLPIFVEDLKVIKNNFAKLHQIRLPSVTAANKESIKEETGGAVLEDKPNISTSKPTAESISTKRGLNFYKSASKLSPPSSPKPSAPPGNMTIPEKSLTASKYVTGNLNNSVEPSAPLPSAPPSSPLPSAPPKYITGNLNNSASDPSS